jgi:Ca2+-binding EF-hand superfamily protein
MIVSLALAWATRCLAADQMPREAEDLIFWAGEQPVFVRLALEVDGQSHRAAWNAAAGRLFDAFDHNADGTLTNDEGLARLLTIVSLELVPDPGVPRGSDAVPLTLRRDALPALLMRRGIGPFCIVAAAARQDAPRLVDNDLLLTVLDEDHSGDLSADELLLSRRGKLDLDDDECLSVRDLLSARIFASDDLSRLQAAAPRMPAGARGPVPRLTSISSPRLAARELLARYDDNRDGLLALDELGLAPHDAATFDQDRNTRLDLAEIEQMLRRPAPTLCLECRWPDGGLSPRTISLGDQTAVIELLPAAPAYSREVMTKLFAETDRDGKGYLEPAEADGLAFLKRAFRIIDRDSDGKLFAEELLEYTERVALLAPRQIVATFQTQSRNVFETIDFNRDERLSRMELRAFAARIPGWDMDGNGAVSIAEVSATARLALGPAVSWTLRPASGSSSPHSLRPPAWFTGMDRNQDGVVSWREFLAPRESFLTLDTSGDGLLDAIEASRRLEE